MAEDDRRTRRWRRTAARNLDISDAYWAESAAAADAEEPDRVPSGRPTER